MWIMDMLSEARGNIGPTDASCIQPNISQKKCDQGAFVVATWTKCAILFQLDASFLKQATCTN